MSNTEEALAAINAVRETEKPVYLSFTLDDNNSKKLRSGENLTVAIDKISKELPNGIMLNCSFPETITSAMPTLAKLNIPFGGYANGFKSIEPLTSGSTVDYLSARIDLTPEIYFNFVEQWINEGATIIGGCCEIGPEHIGYICNILESNGHRLSKLPI